MAFLPSGPCRCQKHRQRSSHRCRLHLPPCVPGYTIQFGSLFIILNMMNGNTYSQSLDLPQMHSFPQVVCPAHQSVCILSEIKRQTVMFLMQPLNVKSKCFENVLCGNPMHSQITLFNKHHISCPCLIKEKWFQCALCVRQHKQTRLNRKLIQPNKIHN